MKHLFIALALTSAILWSDPCGMVPPINAGSKATITRIGLQKTYIFYKNGVETIVIRPGFSGKVDQFGMLIPFPKPPALRKVPDDIFAHIEAAIDPPEVFASLYDDDADGWGDEAGDDFGEVPLQYNTIKVLREEAIGMYEVVVLAAGSTRALNNWMDTHGYKYPKGMDKACNDYIKMRWCFVAVKTRVGQQKGVAARPGMRDIDAKLPVDTTFDGNVQGMGFRFFYHKPIVPMRLSTFNKGSLRNIVYILTKIPCRINSIPKKYVVKQVSGEELYRNLTQLLPLRVLGEVHDITEDHWKNLIEQRDPKPHNAIAGELFATDLLAAKTKKLSHSHEEKEKKLLNIGEAFDLRGPDLDALNATALQKERSSIIAQTLSDLKYMTMTVVDGDFPREIIANENLTFSKYTMTTNDNMYYNTRFHKKRKVYSRQGKIYRGAQRPIKKSAVASWLFLALFAVVVLLQKTLRFSSQS
ncbi:DUF2330 domain-containing protein [Candidatus Uabimicrobium sp. HlEnr_7]|uniref:DUF2330 domain-containing protein n=1 Tax=Candidatus Uabimicrobium helgolandensis TaxID=3095367 RepID=UPI003558D276